MVGVTNVDAAAQPRRRRAARFVGDLPFGRDWPDTGHWADIDGRVYASDNPPMLRVRRAVDRVTRRAA